ncbi:MAG: cation:proton antiporter [Alkalispirochaetaceae bacterium]
MKAILTYLVQLRDLLNQHPLFALGILLLVGFILGRAAGRIRLPEITGFIVAGILMGESVGGIVPPHMSEGLKLITEVALGLIALTIGGEFSLVKLKRLGRGIAVITISQIFATFLLVAAALYLVRFPLPFALLMGAIASATAPAATVAIVQALRARGLFIDYLYGVVALDDAGAVILFGSVFAFVSSIIGGGGESSVMLALGAVEEVLLSVVVGFVSGFLIHALARRRSNPNEILITTLGLLFTTTAVAVIFHLSPLLANMTAGAVIINLSPDNHRIFRVLRPLTPPIYALFFVIAGTELNPRIVTDGTVLILGGIYVLFRAVGKYRGVYVGCAMSGVSRSIRNYLGICMLPQAGVAIGLVLLVEASPFMEGLAAEQLRLVQTMINIVLFSVFVNELLGPPLSRFAILRGNEMEA